MQGFQRPVAVHGDGTYRESVRQNAVYVLVRAKLNALIEPKHASLFTPEFVWKWSNGSTISATFHTFAKSQI